jgi:hypothetical protein
MFKKLTEEKQVSALVCSTNIIRIKKLFFGMSQTQSQHSKISSRGTT